MLGGMSFQVLEKFPVSISELRVLLLRGASVHLQWHLHRVSISELRVLLLRAKAEVTLETASIEFQSQN